MRTRTTTAAVLLAAGLTLTACSSGGDDNSKATHTNPAPPTTSAPAPTTTTPSPTHAAPLRLGETREWTGTQTDDSGQDVTNSGTVTAYGYEQPTATGAPSPQEAFGASSKGYVWGAVDLKVCSTGGTFTVSNSPWSLGYSDDTIVEPSDTGYDDFPKPEFPMGDVTLTEGRCVRGKVVFPVPGKRRPVAVIYSPDGIDDPVLWAVPAK
jgi:hypothetical protein